MFTAVPFGKVLDKRKESTKAHPYYLQNGFPQTTARAASNYFLALMDSVLFFQVYQGHQKICKAEKCVTLDKTKIIITYFVILKHHQ